MWVETDKSYLVGTDPKNSGKIIFQFDAELRTTYHFNTDVPWSEDGIPRIRVMGCLEPATNGQQEVITKQKLINYSTKDYRGQDVKFSNTEFFREYDTDLISDSVPIYIGNIDPVSRKPKGIYFKDTDTNNPYRLDLLFDKSDSFPGK